MANLRRQFGKKDWAMTLGMWAVILLMVGLLLLVAEVFIPSGGILLTLTIGTLAGSLACAWFAWWPGRPWLFWSFLGALLVLIPLTGVGAFWIWPATAIGRRALLEGPSEEEVDAFGDEARLFAQYLGKVGTTSTVLNPAGMLQLGAERLHCQSEGALIDAGVPVVVVRATHNLVIVRPVRTSASAVAGQDSHKPDFAAPRAGASPVRLDNIDKDPEVNTEVPPEFA